MAKPPPKPPEKKNPHVGPSLDEAIAERDARSPGFAAQVEQERQKLEGAREPALTTQQPAVPGTFGIQPGSYQPLSGSAQALLKTIEPAKRGDFGALAQRIAEADRLVATGAIATPEDYIAYLEDRRPGAEEKRGPDADEAEESLLDALVNTITPYAIASESTIETLARLLAEREEIQAKSKVDGPTYNLGRAEGHADIKVKLREILDPADLFHFDLDGVLNRVAEQDEELLDLKASLRAEALATGGGMEERAADTLTRIRTRVLELEQQLQPAHNVFGPKAHARGLLVSHVEDSGPKYDVGGRYRLALVTVNNGQVTIAEAADVVAGQTSHDLPFGLVRDHMEKRLEDFLTPEAHRS